jgi:hypothetical protein
LEDRRHLRGSDAAGEGFGEVRFDSPRAAFGSVYDADYGVFVVSFQFDGFFIRRFLTDDSFWVWEESSFSKVYHIMSRRPHFL